MANDYNRKQLCDKSKQKPLLPYPTFKSQHAQWYIGEEEEKEWSAKKLGVTGR